MTDKEYGERLMRIQYAFKQLEQNVGNDNAVFLMLGCIATHGNNKLFDSVNRTVYVTKPLTPEA